MAVPVDAVAGHQAVDNGIGGVNGVVDKQHRVGGGVIDNSIAARLGGIDCIACHDVKASGAEGVGLEVYRPRLVWQGNVVYPGAVFIAVHAAIFGISKPKCMTSGRDKESGTGPFHYARLGEEVGIVDIEMELVVVGFGRHPVVESDAVGRGEGDGDADFGRLAVAEAGSGAQAVDACIGSVHVDCPRIVALCPARGMVDTALEGLQGIGAYIEGVDCVIA